jgi:predicted transcriptional regulator
MLQENPAMTQRKLPKEAGTNAGTTNFYLKVSALKGSIEMVASTRT